MNKLLSLLICILATSAILSNFYTFYVRKNYEFIVEASCNPETQACYSRDCSEGSECPPNNLEIYKVFLINANDFSRCSDDSCINECINGILQCEEVLCGQSQDDSCTGRQSE